MAVRPIRKKRLDGHQFVYGYTLSDHGQWTLFGWLATDYFIAFPCLVLLRALAFSGPWREPASRCVNPNPCSQPVWRQRLHALS